MVKRKILNRWLGIACATLVLVSCIVPMLFVGAKAMTIEYERDENYEVIGPVLYQMGLPLDILYSETSGIMVENPMFIVAVENAVNQPTNIEMPYIDTSTNFVGTPLGRWSFAVESMYKRTDKSYNVSFGMQIDSGRNYNSFLLKNSSPFVANIAEIYNFLAACRFTVQPGYNLKATVDVTFSFPQLVHESGWELVDRVESQTFSVSNMSESPIVSSIFNSFDFTRFPQSEGNSKLFLIDSFVIKFELYNKIDGFYDNYASASMVNLSFDYVSPAAMHTFNEFYEEYPGHRVITSGDPTGNIFDLTTGLKAAVSGFLSTEVSPGFSFGGLLTVFISIGLVVLFLKVFH